MRRPGRYGCRTEFVVCSGQMHDNINSLEQHAQTGELLSGEPPVSPILKQRSFVPHLLMASS